jgi:hypothetical protein
MRNHQDQPKAYGKLQEKRGTSYLTPVKLNNFFFKNSYLNIWVTNGHRFPLEPVTAPAKGPAKLSPIANPGSNRTAQLKIRLGDIWIICGVSLTV